MAPIRQGFRQRKLSTKVGLQIIREKELEVLENDHTTTPKFESGVEKHEEHEHHLQAAIASQAAAVGGKAAQVYIPTPETVSTTVPYKQLYQTKFSQPATLIRFSSTVEDCCGCPYNLTDEDDVFLKQLNERNASKRGAPGPCSEDQFEMVMYFFEETAKSQQPFSGVGDPPPILTFEELNSAVDDENIDDAARVYAKDIYEHWKIYRSKNSNTAVQPGLKLKIMESSADSDDSDPYVCFRRREVRQVRKTRGRDAQSVEKLKKLRIELESARTLIQLVRAREIAKRDQLLAEKRVFEQRTDLRRLKRGLPEPYKNGDEDLLINQRPPKKRPVLEVNPQRAALVQARASAQRPDTKSTEQELVQLDDLMARRDQEIAKEIVVKKIQHQKWNTEYVDWTNAPLTPPLSAAEDSGFRRAVPTHLPTPPASHSDEEDPEQTDSAHQYQESVHIRYGNLSPSSPSRMHQSFRRRMGRGGRMWIDRRGLALRNKSDMDTRVADRFKYDDDDQGMDGIDLYSTDPYDLNNMRYRAAISSNAPAHTISRQAKPAIEQASSNGQNSQQPTPTTQPAPAAATTSG